MEAHSTDTSYIIRNSEIGTDRLPRISTRRLKRTTGDQGHWTIRQARASSNSGRGVLRPPFVRSPEYACLYWALQLRQWTQPPQCSTGNPEEPAFMCKMHNKGPCH